VKLFKSIVLASFLSVALLNVGNSDAKAQVNRPHLVSISNPIFPFGENGLCSQDCPSIGLRAVVDFLSISVVGQNSVPVPRASLTAGDTISILYLGLDNSGYSNWWEAKGTLVSDASGIRANLGKGVSDDGNDFKAIRVSCDRDFNRCSPNIAWQMLRVDPSLVAGTYSLEVEFTPFSGSGLPVVTHLFGPAVLTVKAKAQTPVSIPSTQSINGRTCPKLGRVRIEQGVRYACISSGKKKIWRKMA
jgi:hypothetical protein